MEGFHSLKPLNLDSHNGSGVAGRLPSSLS